MATNDEKEAALTNLEDDMVKLVAYSIVSLRRDHERVLEGGEGSVIVRVSMTAKAFTSMIIAQYFQGKVADPKDEKKKISRIDALNQDKEWKPKDMKYLRVYYVVSTRWPRQPLEFEEDQVAVLREIANGLGHE